jgi:dihydroorotate dehydrogenase (NAD+) catalytic subunit
MINSIGLENLGLAVFLKDELPRWLSYGKPVIVNISGFSVEEYGQLASALAPTPIAGLEVNISCPNVNQGKMVFGTDPDMAADVTSLVRKSAKGKYIIVKLTPNVTDIVAVARAVAEAGADAISLINTVQAMAIDPETHRPKIGAVSGGLSGPAIKPIALFKVFQVCQAKLGLPVIGIGGIKDAGDAMEFLIAGATAVGIGTGLYANRLSPAHIANGLKRKLSQQGYWSVKDFIGSIDLG